MLQTCAEFAAPVRQIQNAISASLLAARARWCAKAIESRDFLLSHFYGKFGLN
jgi:hypothetical protein